MMRQLWHDIRTHRLLATLFAMGWVGSWVITLVMWFQGGGVGLPGWQLLVVILASGIVGWWRVPTTTHWSPAQLTESMRHGLIVAVVLMWLNLITQAILAVLFGFAIEDPSRTATLQGIVMGLLGIALVSGLFASVVGMLGALIGGTLAAGLRRWRHQGEPPAPAGVP